MLKDRQEAIERMCKLQSAVGRVVHQHHHPYDCFCGERERRDGYTSKYWSNAGYAIEWLESLVEKELRRHWLKRKAVDTLRRLTDSALRRLERRLNLKETLDLW